MNFMQRIWNKVAAVCLAVVLLLALSITAFAANESVTFGSEEYESVSGGEFPVGVYLASDDTITAYEIEIEFDADRLDCQGEAATDNLIILRDTGNSNAIRQRLVFDVTSGGEAYIRVNRAEFTLRDGTSVDVEDLGSAPIYLEGEDTVPAAEEPEAPEEDPEPEAPEEPVIPTPAESTPETEPEMEPAVPAGEPQAPEQTGVVSWFVELEPLWQAALCGGAGLLLLIVMILVLCARRKKKRSDQPAKVKRQKRREERLAHESRRKGARSEAQPVGRREAGRPKTAATGAVRRVDPPEETMEDTAWALDLGLMEDQKAPAAPPVQTTPKAPAPKPKTENAAELAPKKLEKQEKKEPAPPAKPAAADEKPAKTPVISVQNVTMIFRVATSNVSGLKEFLIQKLKHQISYREFRALNDVSFDVYKGEVVGIIGTNGSGKSTMLRIVSGALKPTSGKVLVDRNKVQLLTLGTGFDMELTARENVYLNGSIIGYSREFLDKHYDEIVEFAELGDFMEEKVKNFSSGMVSRLGFSIATAGGAAEILILDEVLSVGDEFFRKKSLARIKEMIHGGSTVLMVSHGMGTILENCTKVVWIEKGDLKMIGEPKKVCAAYQQV